MFFKTHMQIRGVKVQENLEMYENLACNGFKIN